MLAMAIVAAGNSWNISWTPSADNIILMVTTDCDPEHPFRAISRYTITPDQDHALTYRAPVPVGAFCYVVAEVITGTEGDTDSERVSQSATMTIHG